MSDWRGLECTIEGCNYEGSDARLCLRAGLCPTASRDRIVVKPAQDTARYPNNKLACKLCAEGIAHDFKHGLGGHSNHGCRCDICKTAKRDNMRARRADPVKAAAEREKTRARRAAKRAAAAGGDR